MPPVGFEPMISAGERPQTCALDRAATGTGYIVHLVDKYGNKPVTHVTANVTDLQ